MVKFCLQESRSSRTGHWDLYLYSKANIITKPPQMCMYIATDSILPLLLSVDGQNPALPSNITRNIP